MTNVRYIFASGIFTLDGATITSGNLGITVNITISGTNAGEFDLYCNDNDVCIVTCIDGSNDCATVNYFCDGSCKVNDSSATINANGMLILMYNFSIIQKIITTHVEICNLINRIHKRNNLLV